MGLFNVLNLIFKLLISPVPVLILLITVNVSVADTAKRDRVSVFADYSEH